jgi:ribosomal protein S18 acetylase RimI-like enzyme
VCLLTESDVVAELQTNFLKANRDIAEHCATGEVREIDGLLVKFTGVPVGDQNAAFVTRPLRNPDAAIRQAVAYFDERRMPYGIVMRDGLDPASERVCSDIGLALVHTLPGMALEPVPRVIPEPPPGLAIRTVRTAAEHDVHVETDAAGFEVSLDHARRLFPASLYEGADAVEFTGFIGGVPVAVSTLVTTGLTAGVYGVATIPAYRRRGFGEAMTWQAIREGSTRGCRMANLTASDMGRSVYERMGFRVVAPFLIFARPAGPMR